MTSLLLSAYASDSDSDGESKESMASHSAEKSAATTGAAAAGNAELAGAIDEQMKEMEKKERKDSGKEEENGKEKDGDGEEGEGGRERKKRKRNEAADGDHIPRKMAAFSSSASPTAADSSASSSSFSDSSSPVPTAIRHLSPPRNPTFPFHLPTKLQLSSTSSAKSSSSFPTSVCSRFSHFLSSSSSPSFLSDLRRQSEFYSHSLAADTVKMYGIRQFGTNFNGGSVYELYGQEDFYEKMAEKQKKMEQEKWRDASRPRATPSPSLLSSAAPNESFPFEQINPPNSNRNLSVSLMPFGTAPAPAAAAASAPAAVAAAATTAATAAASAAAPAKRMRWGAVAGAPQR